MAAGLGYIEFATGDVLTASIANGYLASQTVMVFASASARTSAITSPQEGMISYLKDTNSTEYYSGSAWTPIAGASASGLTLISATAVSAASAVNIDSVFTSTYTNYKIIYSGTTNAGYTNIQLLYRTSGSTNSNASYDGYVTRFNSSSTSTQLYAYQGNTAGHEIVTAGDGAAFTLEIFSPQATQYTTALINGAAGQITGGYNRAIQTTGYGFFKATTSFDGFRLNAGSDTMTGTVFVYGYQKS